MLTRPAISMSAAVYLSVSIVACAFAHDIEVSGVLGGAKPRAFVNGEVVEKGSTIKDAEVTGITADSVQFRYKNKIINVVLGTGYDLEDHVITAAKQLLAQPAAGRGTTKIELNDMIKLDLMKKTEILELREKYVSEYPELLNAAYKPSEDVFGQVEDGKPWWGILGISYYGSGQKSIEGPSKESRYIINPFLLVAISEHMAHPVNDPSLSPVPICPKPIALEWEGRSKATATFEVGEFWDLQAKYHYDDAGKNEFDLIAYNARDFGFNYLYIGKNESHNAVLNDNKEPIQIRQFIHCGGSCGYPGGCNNMSPYQPELTVSVSSLPATLYIKLWRNKPVTTDSDADMIFIIEIIA